MLPSGGRIPCAILDVLLGLDPCDAYPAQRVITAAEELNDPDRDERVAAWGSAVCRAVAAVETRQDSNS